MANVNVYIVQNTPRCKLLADLAARKIFWSGLTLLSSVVDQHLEISNIIATNKKKV